MITLGGLFVLSLIAQPVLAQTRRTGNPSPAANSNNTPANQGTSSEPGNYRNERADAWIPLEAEKRQAINTDLQATVVELLELYHDAKQSHWNLRGPLYFPLHETLQAYADLYLDQADLLAERQLQIGMSADGRTETITQTANLPKFPAGPLSDRQVLEIMTERIYTIAKRVRARIDSTGKNGDEVTSNKFQDLSYLLDKQVWQFRVHMQ
ncbi:MAG: DNA starvation/stationary phase protection protein [Spirosoma sp.]|nr:DNA starvation/stationary phase protection protein [Spirosoma sp.]